MNINTGAIITLLVAYLVIEISMHVIMSTDINDYLFISKDSFILGRFIIVLFFLPSMSFVIVWNLIGCIFYKSATSNFLENLKGFFRW